MSFASLFLSRFSIDTRSARRAPPLMTVPAWVHAPSRYQQHWIRYGLLSLATSYGALWVFRRDTLRLS